MNDKAHGGLSPSPKPLSEKRGPVYAGAGDARRKMMSKNYDPAHEGELAAQRDNYRLRKAAEVDKTAAEILTADERMIIGKAIRNLEAAALGLRKIVAKANRGRLDSHQNWMILRYDVSDTAEIALGQIKNLL